MNEAEVDRLRAARGESCQVIAVFVDVRGFSAFAGVAESSDTAIYLRDMYTKVVEKYFSDCDYFKPTGDGLMLIQELKAHDDEVKSATQKVIDGANRLVADFHSLTDDNILITIPVPERVGVGISRGSATRIVAEDSTIIDYSGRCLNLAARLMDLARPQGVVFSDRHAASLLSQAQREMLVTDEVYIKGVSEDTKVEIYLTPDWVAIPPSAREPIAYEPAYDRPTTLNAATIRSAGSYLIQLYRPPRRGATIAVHCQCAKYNRDGTSAHSVATMTVRGEVREEPEGAYAWILLTQVKGWLTRNNAPDTESVRFTPRH